MQENMSIIRAEKISSRVVGVRKRGEDSIYSSCNFLAFVTLMKEGASLDVVQ